MSSPRFVPRSYSAQPDLFGKTMLMQWRALAEGSSDSVLDQAAAARRQHKIAVEIRVAILARHGSVKNYAELHNIDYQRISGVLRGQTLMRFEDVANAERNLGLAL